MAMERRRPLSRVGGIREAVASMASEVGLPTRQQSERTQMDAPEAGEVGASDGMVGLASGQSLVIAGEGTKHLSSFLEER